MVYKFQYWSDIFIRQVWTSLDRMGLLIGRVSVAVLLLIMHLTTAIFCLSILEWLRIVNYTCFKINVFPVWFKHKNNIVFIVSKPFLFLYLKCSPNCSKYSLIQQCLKSTKIWFKSSSYPQSVYALLRFG